MTSQTVFKILNFDPLQIELPTDVATEPIHGQILIEFPPAKVTAKELVSFIPNSPVIVGVLPGAGVTIDVEDERGMKPGEVMEFIIHACETLAEGHEVVQAAFDAYGPLLDWFGDDVMANASEEERVILTPDRV